MEPLDEVVIRNLGVERDGHLRAAGTHVEVAEDVQAGPVGGVGRHQRRVLVDRRIELPLLQQRLGAAKRLLTIDGHVCSCGLPAGTQLLMLSKSVG